MLFLLGFIFLTTFGAVTASTLSELSSSCRVNGELCTIKEDLMQGECRTITFSSSSGDLQIHACDKGDFIELYRQDFVEGSAFRACLGEVCVDEKEGFVTIPQEPITTSSLSDASIESLSSVSMASTYPLSPSDNCGSTQTCGQLLNEWNSAAWTDTVDADIDNSGKLAAVRWYTTEGTCTGEKCQDQLHNGNGKCSTLNVAGHSFCGVTDEFGNVLVSHAMGSDEAKYMKLHAFAEKLRVPSLNNLQCWKYYVNGKKDYADYTQLCVETDSASDASLRILGAYGIACAKQRAGLWTSIDYCKDYEEQGEAIWGLSTGIHGEIKYIASEDKYFLCNGFNNQVNCPSASQSFRPDYYELQFLADYAKYKNDARMIKGVKDILQAYADSLGDNHIHKGKTGSFSKIDSSGYQCTDLCTPAYLDNVDTWRAVPAISGLIVVHPELVSEEQKEKVFNYWWNNYGGGNGQYGPTAAKPYEIYSNSNSGKVKSSEDSYKTSAMWIPLSVKYNPTYAKQAVNHLISQYDSSQKQFKGSAYYGAYFSQFAQRSIGISTGMIDPQFWVGNTNAPVTPTTTPTIADISNFVYSCTVTGSYCNLVSDVTTGTCRTVVSKTANGDIQTKICKKDNDYYEIYAQQVPSNDYKVCFANGCVTKNSGFVKFKFESQPQPTPTPAPTPQPTPLTLKDLPVSCTAQGSYCNKNSDNMNGECRFVTYNTNKGTIIMQACNKGDKIELYRNKYPNGLNFEVCLDKTCIDQLKGFAVR